MQSDDSDKRGTKRKERENDEQEFSKRSKTNDGSTTTTHHVSQHYDSKTNQTMETRTQSATYQIRNFNNWLKSVLIQFYVRKGDAVLDLCCGKGGDLQKFAHAKIQHYVGVDVAGECVKEAVQRYNKSHQKFGAKFVQADMTQKTLSDALNALELFDVVSCQFALHYAFESEMQAKKMMQNATDRLKDNGYFIVTVPDTHVLMNKLQTVAKDKTIGNKYYSAVFDKDKYSETQEPYGNRYVFSLVDCLDSCPEYLVYPTHLVQLAKQFDLNVEKEMNFGDFYKKYRNRSELEHLLRIYKLNVDNPMTNEEWDAICIYRVFVFRKNVTKKFNPVNESDIIHL